MKRIWSGEIVNLSEKADLVFLRGFLGLNYVVSKVMSFIRDTYIVNSECFQSAFELIGISEWLKTNNEKLKFKSWWVPSKNLQKELSCTIVQKQMLVGQFIQITLTLSCYQRLDEISTEIWYEPFS